MQLESSQDGTGLDGTGRALRRASCQNPLLGELVVALILCDEAQSNNFAMTTV